jgi:hypothetical protein
MEFITRLGSVQWSYAPDRTMEASRMNPFTDHPNSVGESYWQHMAFALRFGGRMVLGGAAAMLHAFLPFACLTTASRINDELVAMRAASGRRNALGGAARNDAPTLGRGSATR